MNAHFVWVECTRVLFVLFWCVHVWAWQSKGYFQPGPNLQEHQLLCSKALSKKDPFWLVLDPIDLRCIRVCLPVRLSSQ